MSQIGENAANTSGTIGKPGQEQEGKSISGGGSVMVGKKSLAALLSDPKFEETILCLIGKGNEFPVASTTVRVLSELTSAADSSMTELANIILKDYGLTSKILKLVNSVHFIRFGEVTTISRAILLLGIENIKNMVIAMSLFEKLQKTKSRYLPLLLSRAVYAALVGEQIAVKLGGVSTEEAFLCSLFYYLGEILTSYYVPEKYAEIKELVEHETDDGPQSAVSGLQSLFRDIGKTIAHEWGFPGKVVLCMNRVDKSEISSRSEFGWLHCICTIANSIADIAEMDIDDRLKKEKLNSMLEHFGEHFNRLKESLNEITSSSKENLEKYCLAYGIDLQRFSIGEESAEGAEMETNREEVIEEFESDFLAGMLTKENVAEETQDPEVIFANGMRDIARAMLDEYEMEDIFTIIMETIYRGLRPAHIRRAVLLIRNTRLPLYDVRLAMGDSTLSLRKWFLVSVTDGEDDIFNIALKRQKDLLIKDSNSGSTKKLVPKWLAEKLGSPAFIMVLPIIIKGKPIGMIYIEGEREGLPTILPTHFYYIKILHDQAILAIRKKSGV